MGRRFIIIDISELPARGQESIAESSISAKTSVMVYLNTNIFDFLLFIFLDLIFLFF